jgi:hypothetical protein
MRYTLAEGVDRHEEKVQRGLLVSIPIITALLFLGLLGTRHTNRPATNPSHNTPSVKSASTNNSAANNNPTDNTVVMPLANNPSATATATGNPQPNDSTAINSGGSSSPVVGGRGGGPSGAVTPPSPAPGPTPVLPLVYCSPPIDVQTGGKRVLATDGTCITIN